jgi:hypothetical protein
MIGIKLLSLSTLFSTSLALGSELWHFPGDSYDCQSYIDRYVDLENAFGADCATGDTASKANNHWLTNGIIEGRIATPNINNFLVYGITLPSQWTFEAWVYVKSSSEYTRLLSFYFPGQSDCFRINTDGMLLGEWQNLIMTWDGSAHRIFFNGVERSIGSNPATSACSGSPGSLVIGQSPLNRGGRSGGVQELSANIYVDTVAFYSTAWSDSVIQDQCLRTCVDNSDPDLFGLWYEGDTDHTGNGNTADVASASTSGGEYGYCADGACFHAAGTVLLKSGEQKKFSELQIGDVIKTSDGKGTFSFSPVLSLPHASNTQSAKFLNLTTETGKSVIMTPDHFIPKCNFEEVTANKLIAGDCLVTIDGKETLMEISSVEMNGIYTATTENTFIVVDGIVASPYSMNSRPVNLIDTDLIQKSKSALSYIRKRLRGSS